MLDDVESALLELRNLGTTKQREGVLNRFSKAWYGVGIESTVGEPVGGKSRVVPDAYQALARIGAVARSNNRLLQEFEVRKVGQYLVFYVENQGVCEWSFRQESADPPVWFRHNEPGARWRRDSDSMSEFAIKVALFDAVHMSPIGASISWLALKDANKLIKLFIPVAVSPLLFGPTSFYVHAGALLALMKNGSGWFSATLAARHPRSLDFVQDLVVGWERVSF